MSNGKLQIDAIRATIKGKNAKWKAAPTSLSMKSLDEQKKYLGLNPKARELSAMKGLGLDKELTSRYFEKTMKQPLKFAGIPSSIDWRDVNGANWITSIKNQGACGACVAHGTLAALEALLRIRFYKDANKDIELCRAHLLWCGGGSCGGWYMDDACNYLKANGVPDEKCFPYEDHDMPCSDTCPDWKNRIGNTQIVDWAQTMDIKTMKTNLVENGPQITGMAVYQDFFSYSSGVYRHVTGDLAGYHCVAVIGFNDDEECWICKNSWGENWGDKGFFKIGYGECGIDDAFGMWDIKIQESGGKD